MRDRRSRPPVLPEQRHTTSPDLYAAQAAIARAEKHLEAKEYVRARFAAQQAKRHAAAALNEAQHAEAQAGEAPVSH